MRLILRLIEPGDTWWNGRHWLARAGRGPCLDCYRATDPADPPQWLSHEADDVATEIVDRVDDEPIRIYVRNRVGEWRRRMGERI